MISFSKFHTSMIIMLFVSVWAVCQQTEIRDSINKMLNALDNNEAKVDTLVKIAGKYSGSNPDLALKYSLAANQVATSLHYSKGITESLYSIAQIHKTKGNLDSSLYYIQNLINISEANLDSLEMGRGYYQLGNLLRRKMEIENAVRNYNKAKTIFLQLNDTVGRISVSNALGIIFKNNSEYDSAAYYYIETLKLCEEYNYRKGIGPTMINLGKIYYLLQKYDLARSYSLKSFPYSYEMNNLDHVALAYTNLGLISIEEKEIDSAMVNFEKALALYIRIKNKLGQNNVYINQGNIYFDRKEYYRALEKYNQALKVHDKIGYTEGSLTALYSKGGVLSKLGKYHEAEMILDSSLKIAKRFGMLEAQKDIYRNIVENYKARNNYKDALENQILLNKIEDSLVSMEEQRYITNLRLSYEKEKDQARILSLTNENLAKDLKLRKTNNQRNIFLFIGSGTVLVIFFLLIFFRIKVRNDKMMNMQRIRQLEKDKKLMSVQFLMEGQEEERKRIAKELHDGIGVLLSTTKMQFSSVKGIDEENAGKIKKATKMLELATTEVRKITHNMMPGLLTRYGLYEAVEDLIEQINDAGTLNAELNITGDAGRFSEKKEFMLYRIVQEMINNTLKHAQANNLKVRFSISGHHIHLEYSDDGKGFDIKKTLDKNTIGLTSIKSRVNYLGGKIEMNSVPGKGTNYSIDISNI